MRLAVKSAIVFTACTGAAMSLAHAGWEPDVLTHESTAAPGASIRYSSEPSFGLPTLADALSELEKAGHLANLDVVIVNGGGDADFDQQIIDKLQEAAPNEFALALESGGGTYGDPQLEPIHAAFDRVVLETTKVRNIATTLGTYGKRISSVSHEKLFFRHVNDRLVVIFFLYLGVEEQ